MNIRKALIACVALSLLSGCATTKYQCPTPTGVACMSAKEVYNLTDAPGDEGMQAATGVMKGGKKQRQQVAASAPPPAAQAQGGVPLPMPGDVVPIREQSHVMRIWIAPYEDTDGNLVMATRVYTDMDARKWSVGEPATHQSNSFFPMQVDPSAPAPASNSAATPGAQATVTGMEKVTPRM